MQYKLLQPIENFMKRFITVPLLLGCALHAVGQGTFLWNESVNGPLSNNADFPTALPALQLGTNSLIGAAQAVPNATGWMVYDDVFTFQVPSGFHVTSLQFGGSRTGIAWIGDPPFLIEYGSADGATNGDLLPQWALSQIGSGTYGMYVGDRDLQALPTELNYRLDFFVEAIPEPAAAQLLTVGLAAFLLCGKRGKGGNVP